MLSITLIDCERSPSTAAAESFFTRRRAGHRERSRPFRQHPGIRTAQTTLAAPSWADRPPRPISVAVQPGLTTLTRTSSRSSSAARDRVSAFNAALLT